MTEVSVKSWSRVALALGTLALIVTACAPRTPAESSIHIGVVLPLTGSAAEWGTPPRDALLLATAQINAKGGIKGKKVILDIEDDKCEPATGVSALQKILATSKPVAVVGAVCSSVTLALAPIAESNKVVLISPASTSPLITNAGDYIFRVIPSDTFRGKAFAQYIYAGGHRSVSALYINNDGGLGNKNAFVDSFSSLGGKVISVDAYPPDTRDLRAQLTKIKQQPSDALLVVSYPADTPLVLRQAAELGIRKPQFFQTEALDDPAVIANAGAAAEGATYILAAKPHGPAVDEFSKEYQAKYHRNPELFAAEGFDALHLIDYVLSATADLSSLSLKDGLYKVRGYAGSSGVITFDKNGDVTKPMAIKKIQNGQGVLVTEQ